MKLFDRTMALTMVYALLFPLVVTLAINRAHWGDFLTWLTGDGGSGWFQAIGSVATILFSGLFVARQIEAGRELEVDRRAADFHSQQNRALRALVYHAQAVASLCRSLAKHLERDGHNPTRIRALSAQLNLNHDALWKVDPSVLPDSLVGSFYQFNLDFSRGMIWCEAAALDRSQCLGLIDQLKDISADLDKEIEKIRRYEAL